MKASTKPRVLAAILASLAAPAATWGETGGEAFDRQDYARALELWQSAATEGSDEAEFGLGLIYDLGLGVPRNSAAALRWYLEAAGDGFADAQFNVAVMLDAGTGTPRDPAAAATWYARAAANGNVRAQYNLALLYEGGIGVPRNLDLARVWFEAASPTLAAAATRLSALPPPSAAVAAGAPHPVTGAIIGPADRPRAELVWTVTSGAPEFQVEVARRPAGLRDPGEDDMLASQPADRTAAVLALPLETGGDLAWRVGRRIASDLVDWSPWQDLPRGVPAAAPQVMAQTTVEGASDRLTIYVNPGDHLASAFAEELSQAYARGGVDATIREAAQPARTTSVEYHHSADAALAAAVAGLLPSLPSDATALMPESGVAPGEVTLRLVGGPQPQAQLDG